jgi:hypothetical protein
MRIMDLDNWPPAGPINNGDAFSVYEERVTINAVLQISRARVKAILSGGCSRDVLGRYPGIPNPC